ncbi:uncharacterized protein LOC128231992 [Mya arenaria]|uniref:uncharacterized protein LOC128231992 n=1 Tax=Mya arenaria TaxID=6604 RepID=UPI0022E51630|nr:uncharacterized protein LOC128231992 [Mya arenaria]
MASKLPIYMPIYPPKPPLLGPPTPGLPWVPPCKFTGSCCALALGQLPADIEFAESALPGTLLAEMKDVTNITMNVNVEPTKFQALFDGVFNVTSEGNVYSLVLVKRIDLEHLYKLAGDDPEVANIVLIFRCQDNSGLSTLLVPPRHVMVSIVDVDDSLPEFQSRDAATSGGCVVPLFSADTSEDYMGELSLSPGTLRAVDGDMTSQNNISYSVMHSEPDDYDVYFHVDEETGRVNKTRKMNSTDPNKYVIFVKAMEDSPQQQSRVAIVSIVVIAPSDPNTDPQSSVNPIVRLVLQIATVFILMAFIVGCVVIFHHRYQVHHSKVKVKDMPSNDNNAKVQFAVYQSSNSSLNTTIPDNPASPSQVTLDNDHLTVPQWNYATGAGFVKSPSSTSLNTINTRRGSVYSNQSQRRKMVVVKKPLDTKQRPGWNAPPTRPKRTSYNPFSVWKQKVQESQRV